jgi:glycosyltransferase involved in cell wall biosynthesis
MLPPCDALLLGPHPGMSSYSIANYFNFCRRQLPGALPDWRIGALAPGDITLFDQPRLVPAARYRAWRHNYMEWPVRLRLQRAQLVHIVDQGLTWYAAFLPRCRRVATVNDLIAYLACCGKLVLDRLPVRRRPLVWASARQIRKMDHVISVSRYTADCLVRELGIPAARITVVHHHVDPCFSPLSADERRRARRRWFDSTEAAIIHVGNASAYKNRIGALKTFAVLLAKMPEARMFLVHGPPQDEERKFLTESGCARAVRFLAPLSRPELREFYGAADALIFPSVYEGFGWPPLEAMACGCPVVSTTRTSLKEVVGDAALTVDDPHDYRALAGALSALLQDSHTARDLRGRGLARAQQFAPSRALAQIAEVYRSLAP